jgi:hypothetical protein
MSSDLDPSARALAIACCFVLVTYILYFYGSNSQPSQPQPEIQLQPYPQSQSQTISDNDTNPDPPNPKEIDGSYDRGFQDGMKAAMKFDIHDMKLKIEGSQKENERRQKETERMLKEIKELKNTQNIQKSTKAPAEQRQLETKNWLEDLFRLTWEEGRRASEKGLRGWWRNLGKKRGSEEPPPYEEGFEKGDVKDGKIASPEKA